MKCCQDNRFRFNIHFESIYFTLLFIATTELPYASTKCKRYFLIGIPHELQYYFRKLS